MRSSAIGTPKLSKSTASNGVASRNDFSRAPQSARLSAWASVGMARSTASPDSISDDAGSAGCERDIGRYRASQALKRFTRSGP